MPDDVAARALAKELMGVPSMGTPQQIETQFTFLLTAALRTERRAGWLAVASYLEQHDSEFIEYDGPAMTIIFNIEQFADWCRAQAEKEGEL